MAGERGKPVLSVIESAAQVFFGIVGIVMRAAPLGAFGAMAFTIGKYGIGSLASLAELMAAFYTTCLIFVFVILGTIARLTGFSILRFIRYIKEELLIVLGTSSSESVLPRMLAKMENLGCDKSVVGLVIPTGYSFNLDGTCIYLTMAAVFLAQATNTPLSLGQELGLIGILLLTSKGAAGVTGSGFIVLAATLSSLGTVPVASIALILGVVLTCGAVASAAPAQRNAGAGSFDTPDYRIETDETHYNMNTGVFTMPHRVRFFRPGTDATSPKATGNSKLGTCPLSTSDPAD